MDQLKALFADLNIATSNDVISKFVKYRDGVLDWNDKINLTSITDPQEFVKKHYVDSLICAGEKEIIHAKRMIDVGTGAGFPGIPLALVFPEKQFVLLDSLGKRIKVIKNLCDEIGISNVEVIHGRAEELAQDKAYREQFDICVSRAVAKLPVLAEYCLPFVKKGGFFIAYKSGQGADELDQAKKALKALGSTEATLRKKEIPGFDLDHCLIFIHKTSHTPPKYPRKPGIPSKTPLI